MLYSFLIVWHLATHLFIRELERWGDSYSHNKHSNSKQLYRKIVLYFLICKRHTHRNMITQFEIIIIERFNSIQMSFIGIENIFLYCQSKYHNTIKTTEGEKGDHIQYTVGGCTALCKQSYVTFCPCTCYILYTQDKIAAVICSRFRTKRTTFFIKMSLNTTQ